MHLKSCTVGEKYLIVMSKNKDSNMESYPQIIRQREDGKMKINLDQTRTKSILTSNKNLTCQLRAYRRIDRNN